MNHWGGYLFVGLFGWWGLAVCCVHTCGGHQIFTIALRFQLTFTFRLFFRKKTNLEFKKKACYSFTLLSLTVLLVAFS